MKKRDTNSAFLRIVSVVGINVSPRGSCSFESLFVIMFVCSCTLAFFCVMLIGEQGETGKKTHEMKAARLELRSTGPGQRPGCFHLMSFFPRFPLLPPNNMTQKKNKLTLQTNIMKNNASHEQLPRGDTLMPTTDTMRKKAEFVSRWFIYMLKCLRCTKCDKSAKKCNKKTEK